MMTDNFLRKHMLPAFTAGEIFGQEGTCGLLEMVLRRSCLLHYLNSCSARYQPLLCLQKFCYLLLALLIFPASASGAERDWSIGVYAGQYYDTEPAGFSQGKAGFLDQYIAAITASKTLWRDQALPLSFEIDGMLGHQFGLASLQEIAIAPVVSWSGFPWNATLQTDVRVGPLGLSYTTSVSPLERGPSGNGSQTLNFFFVELGFSLPEMKSKQIFMRLHHRCSSYDLINNYGANGEDFFALGYRLYY